MIFINYFIYFNQNLIFKQSHSPHTCDAGFILNGTGRGGVDWAQADGAHLVPGDRSLADAAVDRAGAVLRRVVPCRPPALQLVVRVVGVPAPGAGAGQLVERLAQLLLGVQSTGHRRRQLGVPQAEPRDAAKLRLERRATDPSVELPDSDS